MSYKISFSETALKQLRNLDATSRKRVLTYVNEVLSKIENPRILGKALTGELKGLWRYRIGNFRIVCQIQDNKLLILVETVQKFVQKGSKDRSIISQPIRK